MKAIFEYIYDFEAEQPRLFWVSLAGKTNFCLPVFCKNGCKEMYVPVQNSKSEWEWKCPVCGHVALSQPCFSDIRWYSRNHVEIEPHVQNLIASVLSGKSVEGESTSRFAEALKWQMKKPWNENDIALDADSPTMDAMEHQVKEKLDVLPEEELDEFFYEKSKYDENRLTVDNLVGKINSVYEFIRKLEGRVGKERLLTVRKLVVEALNAAETVYSKTK